MNVFVYGTLKAGYGNHRLLEGKTMLGIGVTDIRYNMISGGFPVVMAADNGLLVKGEVYDITGDLATLDNLDRLEGEGVMYNRREIPVTLENGDRIVCCIYEGTEPYWGRRMANPENDRFMNAANQLEWHR